MTHLCLVVGIGNAIQGPDAFGPAVVARLRDRADLPAAVRLADAGADLLSLIDRFDGMDDVVIVDAFLGDGTGAVRPVDEVTFSTWSVDSPGSHDVSATLVVRLFRRLYPGSRAHITLVGLDVERVDTKPLPVATVDAGAEAVLDVLRAAARSR